MSANRFQITQGGHTDYATWRVTCTMSRPFHLKDKVASAKEVGPRGGVQRTQKSGLPSAEENPPNLPNPNIIWCVVCGVTNWLLSLTGYGNNRLSPTAARTSWPHCRQSVRLPLPFTGSVSTATLSLPLVLLALVKHHCTYMKQAMQKQTSTPSLVLEVRRCHRVKVGGAGNGE